MRRRVEGENGDVHPANRIRRTVSPDAATADWQRLSCAEITIYSSGTVHAYQTDYTFGIADPIATLKWHLPLAHDEGHAIVQNGRTQKPDQQR